jgi:hypothetical protein
LSLLEGESDPGQHHTHTHSEGSEHMPVNLAKPHIDATTATIAAILKAAPTARIKWDEGAANIRGTVAGGMFTALVYTLVDTPDKRTVVHASFDHIPPHSATAALEAVGVPITEDILLRLTGPAADGGVTISTGDTCAVALLTALAKA